LSTILINPKNDTEPGRMRKLVSILVWAVIVALGAAGFAMLALKRGETVNAAWLLTAAVCTYAVGYRFYSRFLAYKVFGLDDSRATPAERLDNQTDFMPTNKWVLFGHHFAAIAGAGPLVGPVLAAQFGFLPGTIWLIIGVVLGGAVQDFIILFASMRRNGKSLGQMAREEINSSVGMMAMIAIVFIIVILLAVLALIVVNALKASPWGLFTIGCTIPIALLMGWWMKSFRPGKVMEASIIGVGLTLFAVVAGGWVAESATWSRWFTASGTSIAWMLMAYGFAASVLPVWLLLAPRDYLSTFLKVGTVVALAIGILIALPPLRMPALTPFVAGTGPVFAGKLFPFAFITIACGAISGFHALVSSGTTPKMLAKESHARMIGYGGMLMESFVGVMAMIAACVLDPGVFFAINAPAGVVGASMEAATTTITNWGFVVTPEQMRLLASQIGEQTLLARTGGAPSLAVGMAHIFSSVLGGTGLLALWYHFAIMFEALFILTTLDAGTRVGRFMVQELMGHVWKPMAQTSWYPSAIFSSALIVAGWGYFLYQGVVDPLGGINSLWPLFGISNQLLAAVALCLGTTVLIKMGKARHAWVTLLPLAWLGTVTLTAGLQKVFSDDPKLGFLSHAETIKAALAEGRLPAGIASIEAAQRVLFNDRLNAVVASVFMAVAVLVILASLREWVLVLMHRRPQVVHEAPFVPSALATGD
jgi:carbon starvation protein